MYGITISVLCDIFMSMEILKKVRVDEKKVVSTTSESLKFDIIFIYD